MLRDNGLGSPAGGHGAGQALLLSHPSVLQLAAEDFLLAGAWKPRPGERYHKARSSYRMPTHGAHAERLVQVEPGRLLMARRSFFMSTPWSGTADNGADVAGRDGRQLMSVPLPSMRS